jgi:hypothetical protein
VREFLRECVHDELDDEAIRELHARLAPAFAQAGRREEEIEHWLAAEAWTEAAATIAEVAPAIIHTSPATVRRWLDALPPDVRAAPNCMLLQGTLELEDGRYAEAVELLTAAMRGFEAAGDTAGQWLARFALMDQLALMGEWEEEISLADGFDDTHTLAARNSRSRRSSVRGRSARRAGARGGVPHLTTARRLARAHLGVDELFPDMEDQDDRRQADHVGAGDPCHAGAGDPCREGGRARFRQAAQGAATGRRDRSLE